MKTKKINSLALNKKSISNLTTTIEIKGGVSGGNSSCLPTTLRTVKHNCQYTTDCSKDRDCRN